MRNLFVLVISIGFLMSCQKEVSPITDEVQSNYFPLDIGNYWVYQNYKIDTLGNEKKLSFIDSLVVIRDTMIKNDKWFVLAGREFVSGDYFLEKKIVRDSLGYIIDIHGRKLFSKDNFKDTLFVFHQTQFGDVNQDTIYSITSKMEQTDEKVIVPAGEFIVLNCKWTVYSTRQRPNIRYVDTYFADKVGEVQHSYYYFSSPEKYERRLLRFHVKQ